MSENQGKQDSGMVETGAGQEEPLPERGPAGPGGLGGAGADFDGSAGLVASVLGLPLRAWDTIAMALLVVAADVCLFQHPGGTGAAVLLLVTTVGLLSAAPGGFRSGNPGLMLTMLLLAGMSAWNHWWLAGFLSVLAAAAFAVKLHRPEWAITEVTWSVPWTAALAPFRLAGHLLHVLGYGVKAKTGEIEAKRHTPFRVVLIPLVVTVLFVLVFIAANPVVEKIAADVSKRLGEWLGKFIDLFTLPRMFSWLGWLLVFAALLRPHVRSWLGNWLTGRREDLSAPAPASEEKGDYAAALATLISVNVLFLAFNALDSVYLYFKAEFPEGISYSDYSHRGCFWLTLALALSSGVIGLIFRRRMNFHPRTGLLRAWAYVWAAQNGVLMAGALRRLQMYIDYNGLTRARIVGLYGILLVGVGLVLMVWKVRRAKNFTWLVRRDGLAFWVALVVLAVTPRDAICWRYNARQAMAGNLRPLANLTVQDMSPESYPPLIRLLEHREPWVQQGIAGYLGQKLDELERSEPQAWTRRQGARVWAFRRLEAAKGTIWLICPRERWKEAEEELFRRVSPWVHSRASWD